MSAQNPYEKLGVSEGASFEEIQTARNLRVGELEGDQRKIAEVEAAYDAVLMERLRLRQEGKIKVPDRIRFPEKLTQPALVEVPAPSKPASHWFKKILDTPSATDVMLPAGVMAVLGGMICLAPQAGMLQLAMAIATGSTLYFIYRKEQKLFRSVLLGLGGLVLGFVAGGALYQLLQAQLSLPNDQVFVSLVTFLVLWLFSSFTK